MRSRTPTRMALACLLALPALAAAETDPRADVPDPQLDIVPYGLRLNETHVRPYVGVDGSVRNENHYVCQMRAALDGTHQTRQVYEVRWHDGRFTATYHRTEPKNPDGSGPTTTEGIVAGGVVEDGRLVNWSIQRVDDYHAGIRTSGEGGWAPKCLASKHSPDPLVWGTATEAECDGFTDTDCTGWGWTAEVRTRPPQGTTSGATDDEGSDGDDPPGDARGAPGPAGWPLLTLLAALAVALRRRR